MTVQPNVSDARVIASALRIEGAISGEIATAAQGSEAMMGAAMAMGIVAAKIAVAPGDVAVLGTVIEAMRAAFTNETRRRMGTLLVVPENAARN